MVDFLNDPTTLYILIGCSCFVLVMLLTCICILCTRKKRNLRMRKPSLKDSESVEMDSLLFVYERNVENQQSPTRYPASCPVSPSENERTLKRSLSHLDITPIAERRCSVSPCELDLSMYQTEEELTSSPYSGLGKLSLQLTYDQPNEKLTVHVQKGVNIQAKQTNSLPSPYLKVCLLPDKKRRMHSKTRKGEHPIFNEDFIFSLPVAELAKRTVRIVVCDFDRFSRQTVLGYIVVCLQDLMEKLMDIDGTGEIWKELTDNDAMPGLKKGELLFSMSYLPTAGRMTIAVVQARNLIINEEKETGISVKVNLILNGKVVKSKKTSIHKSILTEPTFNESYVYDLTTDLLDRASFIFIVYAYSHNGKRIIGKANTGPYMYSTGTGLTHWNDMLLQPRRAVTHWHKLM